MVDEVKYRHQSFRDWKSNRSVAMTMAIMVRNHFQSSHDVVDEVVVEELIDEVLGVSLVDDAEAEVAIVANIMDSHMDRVPVDARNAEVAKVDTSLSNSLSVMSKWRSSTEGSRGSDRIVSLWSPSL